MKTLNFLMIQVLFSTALLAQPEADLMAYQAYISNNKGLWKQLVTKQQAAFDKAQTNETRYHLLLAQHGLLNNTLADKDEGLFDQHFKMAKENIASLVASDYKAAEARAILSAIYGWEMAYSSYKGIFLGGKSSSNIKKATELDPSSPLVWQVYGSSKLFTPEMFGGDITEAVDSFEKAIRLYETDSALHSNNWRYLDALAWLGQAYESNNQKELAIRTYEKILDMEPEFGWVKFALLPNVTQ